MKITFLIRVIPNYSSVDKPKKGRVLSRGSRKYRHKDTWTGRFRIKTCKKEL